MCPFNILQNASGMAYVQRCKQMIEKGRPRTKETKCISLSSHICINRKEACICLIQKICLHII